MHAKYLSLSYLSNTMIAYMVETYISSLMHAYHHEYSSRQDPTKIIHNYNKYMAEFFYSTSHA